MAYAAVQGCTIVLSSTMGTIGGSHTEIPADSFASSGGNKIYKNKITVTVGPLTATLLAPPPGASSNIGMYSGPGVIDIEGSSTKSTLSGDKIVVQGDEGEESFNFLFTQIAGPTPVSVSIPVKATVANAGQMVVNVT